jgi:hypothetical protein
MPERFAAEALASELAAAPDLEPFADDAVACCGELSRTLSDLAGGHTELMALAHWLRPVSVLSMRQQFGRLSEGSTARAPRGLVFHLAPDGSDATAGYSLALSMLVGNRNLVRVPPGAGEQAELLCEGVDSVLAADRFADIRAGTALVRYEPDPELDEAFSRACEVRIVWGEEDRRVPLAPAAKEVALPDRFSFAIASAGAYLQAGEAERDRLAEKLHLDAPQVLVWVGTDANAKAAGRELFARLPGNELILAAVPEPSRLSEFASLEHETVTAYGLRAEELALAGAERVVPWGQALGFERRRDRLELLAELTRSVPARAAA